MRSFLFVLPASLLLLGSGAPSNEPGKGGGKGTPANKVVAAPAPPFDQLPGNWVDSVFKTLTAEERIAQLFMVAAYSNQSKAHEDKITRLVEQHK
ncbi:MAG: hypothetical protein AAGB22_03110, partial [Bacteroidota bacterium]